MKWGSFDEDVVRRSGSQRSAWFGAGASAISAIVWTATVAASGGDWKAWSAILFWSFMTVWYGAIAWRWRGINGNEQDPPAE